MIRAIIFDYYGVIRPDIFMATYSHFGGDPEADAEFIADTIYASNSGRIPSSIPVISKRLGISPHEWAAKITEPQNHDQKLLDYILQLRKKYKTALLSNVSRGRLPELWEDGHLEKYFDVAIGSGDTNYAKPDAAIFKLIADKLRVKPEECVMVDDRADYCQGASFVGMRAICYTSLKQLKSELNQLLTQS